MNHADSVDNSICCAVFAFKNVGMTGPLGGQLSVAVMLSVVVKE